jgi:hypothetical protein
MRSWVVTTRIIIQHMQQVIMWQPGEEEASECGQQIEGLENKNDNNNRRRKRKTDNGRV